MPNPSDQAADGSIRYDVDEVQVGSARSTPPPSRDVAQRGATFLRLGRLLALRTLHSDRSGRVTKRYKTLRLKKNFRPTPTPVPSLYRTTTDH